MRITPVFIHSIILVALIHHYGPALTVAAHPVASTFAFISAFMLLAQLVRAGRSISV